MNWGFDTQKRKGGEGGASDRVKVKSSEADAKMQTQLMASFLMFLTLRSILKKKHSKLWASSSDLVTER